MKWRKTACVLRDKINPIKLKGKWHRTVVRSSMMYGTEFKIINRNAEQK